MTDPYNDFLIIVPSRGRPDNVRRLIDRWNEWDVKAWLLIALDDDDPTLEEYKNTIVEADGYRVCLVIMPRKRLAPTLSSIAVANAEDTYKYIGFMGDDHLPQTPGWETVFRNALGSSDPSIVYGNDLFQGANIPTAVFMSASIISKLGYMCPPGFVHLYLDNVWKRWGEGMGRLRYFDNVIIEHLHPEAGKSEWDDRYVEVNSEDMYDSDRAAFDRYMIEQFDNDITKLKELL